MVRGLLCGEGAVLADGYITVNASHERTISYRWVGGRFKGESSSVGEMAQSLSCVLHTSSEILCVNT